MTLSSLEDLYVAELQDMHSAEMQLTLALPKMARAASSPGLRSALESHLQATRSQLERLKSILEDLGKAPNKDTCEAMEGLVAESAEMIGTDGDAAVRDAGLIAHGQKVEHYEIASYGCLKAFAHLLGREQHASLLKTSLDEEKEADYKLNQIAEGGLNRQALHAAHH